MSKIVKSLVALADYLDNSNKAHQADKIDIVIRKISSVSKKIEFVSKFGDKIAFAVSSDGSVSHSYQQSAASKSKGGEGRSEEESQMHNYGMGSKNFSIAELIDKGGPDFGNGAFKDFYQLTPASKVSLKEIYKKNRAAIHSRDDGTNSSKIDVGTFGDRFKKYIGYYDGLNTMQDPLFADPFAEPSPKSSPLPKPQRSSKIEDYGQGMTFDDVSKEIESAAGTFLKQPGGSSNTEVSYGDRLNDETMTAIPPTMQDLNEYNVLEDKPPIDIGWANVTSVIFDKTKREVTEIKGNYQKGVRGNRPFVFNKSTVNKALSRTLSDLKRNGLKI